MDKYAEIRAALDAGVTGASDPSANWLCVGDYTVMLNSGKPIWARIAKCEHPPNAAYIAACHPEAIRALLAERDALREALQSIVDCCDEDHAARDYSSRQTEIRGIARYALTMLKAREI